MDCSVKNLKEVFKDWENIQYGEWSKYAYTLKYHSSPDRFIDIMLYREPMENEDYAGTYTLQVFVGDDVIFCQQVDMDAE